MNKLIAMMADADTDAASIETDDNDDREDSWGECKQRLLLAGVSQTNLGHLDRATATFKYHQISMILRKATFYSVLAHQNEGGNHSIWPGKLSRHNWTPDFSKHNKWTFFFWHPSILSRLKLHFFRLNGANCLVLLDTQKSYKTKPPINFWS